MNSLSEKFNLIKNNTNIHEDLVVKYGAKIALDAIKEVM